MRPLVPLLASTLLLAAAPCVAGALDEPSAERRAPLRAGLCLDPRRGVDWDRIDDRHLIVASVGRYYLIGLRDLCHELGFTPTIVLSPAGTGRICGHAGEYLVANRARCPIAWVDRLDKELYMEFRDGRSGGSRER